MQLSGASMAVSAHSVQEHAEKAQGLVSLTYPDPYRLAGDGPGGKAIILSEGIVRARYRESYELPTLIEPNAIYEYRFKLWETSNLFKADHRIRLEISSSNFPRFDRNPNTGHPFGADAELQKATQTVYHDAERASHILLPIVP